MFDQEEEEVEENGFASDFGIELDDNIDTRILFTHF